MMKTPRVRWLWMLVLLALAPLYIAGCGSFFSPNWQEYARPNRPTGLSVVPQGTFLYSSTVVLSKDSGGSVVVRSSGLQALSPSSFLLQRSFSRQNDSGAGIDASVLPYLYPSCDVPIYLLRGE
jgi:hypothetical protein